MMEKERERTPAPLKKKKERNPGEKWQRKRAQKGSIQAVIGWYKIMIRFRLRCR